MEQHMESPTRGAWQGMSAEETAAVLCLRGSFLQKPSLEALEAVRDTDPFPSLSSCPCEMVLLAYAAWLSEMDSEKREGPAACAPTTDRKRHSREPLSLPGVRSQNPIAS